jgi:DNA-binding XRE family transcriptional regulator
LDTFQILIHKVRDWKFRLPLDLSQNDRYNRWLYIEHSTYPISTKKHTQLIPIGEQIRNIRKMKGFSQENFANFIEMNRGYYGTIERGETNVTVLNLLKILKGLDV